VPGTLLRKWCGILWDSNLSFLPFLKARVGAARAAFLPLCSLVREGTAPLEEVRAVALAKVEGALFYGAMFLVLEPTAPRVLAALQVEFERAFLGAPGFISPAVVRAVTGWRLSWDEKLIYEVLAFRAELWCARAELLVHDVWRAAQHFTGATFARASRCLLE